MGCNFSNSSAKTPIEQDFFTQIDRCFNFHLTFARDIDSAFYKFSYNSFITKESLAKVLSTLKIPISDVSDTFRKFKLDNVNESEGPCYSSRKLRLLGTLLGKGVKQEKTRILFYIYDTEVRRTLEKAKIYEMIEEIFEIGLKIVPEMAVEVWPSEFELTDSKDKLMLAKKSTAMYFCLKLIGEKKKMLYEEFEEKFRDAEIVKLLDLDEIRKFAIRVSGKLAHGMKALKLK